MSDMVFEDEGLDLSLLEPSPFPPLWSPDEPSDQSPFALEVHTARELCELPDPPASDQLLGPLIVRRYRTIIAGGTGEGKTTLALAAIAAVTRGSELLGWRGAGGRALVIDLEQGLRTIKRRLQEAGLDDSDDVDYLRVPDGLALDRDQEHVEAVERLLAGGYDVVLLDPIYKAHRGDSNDERAIVDLMRTLDRWRDEHGFALILPAHTRKKLEPKAKLTIDDVFGSSAAVRGAEVVVGLQRISDGYSRLYAFKDRDGDSDLHVGEPWGLLFDREAGFTRDPADTAPPRDLEGDIRAFLSEHPHSTTNEVAKAVEAGKQRVSDLLKATDGFSFDAGPNNARLWVTRPPQNHPGHLFATLAVSGDPLSALSVGEHTEVTHDQGDPELDWS